MTNEPQGPTHDGDEPETVTPIDDPVIAREFSRLETHPLPTAEAILGEVESDAITVAGTAPQIGTSERSMLDGVTQYRVLAAAAVAAVLAISAVALSNRGDDTVGTDEVAGQATVEADSATDEQADEDQLTSEAVVDDVAEMAGDSSDDVVSEVEDDSAVEQPEPEDESVLVIQEPDDGADTTADDSATSTTPTTAADDSSNEDDQPEGETAEESGDEIPPPTTEAVVENPPVETTRISGTVTEVMVDCVSHQVLGDDGSIQDVGAVTCDGGSFIVVNGTRIFTSAGYTAAEFYWDKHNSKLRPGISVSVVAAPVAGGPLGLACDECGVRIG